MPAMDTSADAAEGSGLTPEQAAECWTYSMESVGCRWYYNAPQRPFSTHGHVNDRSSTNVLNQMLLCGMWHLRQTSQLVTGSWWAHWLVMLFGRWSWETMRQLVYVTSLRQLLSSQTHEGLTAAESADKVRLGEPSTCYWKNPTAAVCVEKWERSGEQDS